MAFFAQRLANKFGHNEILPQHVLLAMVKQPDSMVKALIVQVDGDPSRLVRILESNLDSKVVSAADSRAPILSEATNIMLDRAQEEAMQNGSSNVCCEYVLFAMLELPDISDMLETVNLTRESIAANVDRVRCARTPKPKWW